MSPVFSFPADLVSAAWKGKLKRRVTRASMGSPISGFVSVCRSRRSNLLETFVGFKKRTAPSLIPTRPTPEFQSKPNKPHPLFKGFIQACLAFDPNRETRAATDPKLQRRVPRQELVLQR